MFEIVKSTWQSGLRSRYFYGVALLAFLMVGVAYLAASFSARAPRTVALDVGFSGLRISLIVLGLLWIQESFSGEIDRRTVMLSLSYPISRGAYVIGRILGVMALGAVAAVALALALLIAAIASGAGYDAQGFVPDLGLPLWATVLGLWLESVVVIAFAAAVAAISTTPMLAFVAGAGFALAGASLGAAMQYLMEGGDKTMSPANLPILNAIHWLLPDLSRLDWRLWPMYQMTPDYQAMAFATLAALAYTAVMLGFAVWAFSRREFS